MSEKLKTIVLPNSIIVRELALLLETSPIQIIKVLLAVRVIGKSFILKIILTNVQH